ncbi:MAG: hypothetical protein HQK77_17640 [Desulfobacterales bacterium]|nr:hypothetical protein [Desulfobacterales bacterium]
MVNNHLSKGISLIEILIALVSSSILLTMLMTFYVTQLNANRDIEQRMNIQDNVRSVMMIFEDAIRMAGFDSTELTNAGLVDNFPSTGNTVGAHFLAFTMDQNQNGIIETNSNERVAYRLNSNNLEMYNDQTDQWVILAVNISDITYTYYDGANPPVQTAVLADVRSIEISITSVIGDQSSQTTSWISCRNLR